MRTIGRRWPKEAPRGDFQATCAYCGATWRRSSLRRDEAGLLRCPDEGPGAPAVQLDRENQERAARRVEVRPMDDSDRNKL